MTIKDLIKNKDHDRISIRRVRPEKYGGGDVFCGPAKSINGKLVSLDGDTYSENEEVLSYEEWSNPEKGVENGLTIVLKGGWV